MHLHINSPRRLVGAAAIACAAALIPVAALGATTAAAAPAARTPACATSGLVVWMNTQGSSGMYHTEYNLYFTNLSGHACTLRGSPGVSAVSLSGHQLGRAASGNYSGNVPAVRLASGATAQALLSIAAVSASGGNPPLGCRTVTAAGLRVYPPNEFASKVIPMPFTACASRAGPNYMSIGPVQKG
jgi:hypothetical protein